MTYEEVGLTAEEFTHICNQMGRVPNDLELGLFGVLWSEHCSYKSSKNLLAWLPHDGPAVVQGPGENAGVVQLDDKVHVAFKVESHNHPSYVEPVQGAATGVGGILRDIVAMGARPVALADSLRFGTDDPSQHLQHAVVEGVGAYGNAIGIPTVTGEVGYGAVYDKNPLVNVMAVGLLPAQRKISARGARPGSYLLLVGQPTGRDGIHGASLLASQDFGEGTEHMRPTVQVGDPFMGKLLMEATLAAVETGLLDAVQDLGAAGLTSAIAELVYRSQVGAQVWLDDVPCREPHMTPYEIMLSETQERMLLIVAPHHLEAIEAIMNHWELPHRVIGEVTEEPLLVIGTRDNPRQAVLPPEILAGACPLKPVPANGRDKGRQLVPSMPAFKPLTLEREWGLNVLGAPECKSRAPIYQRYDSMILTNTVWGPDHPLAVLRVKDSTAGLAIAVRGPGRYAALDPYSGGMAAVARVISLLATQGAQPLGLTDGINAGNPDREDVFQDLMALLAGIADASQALGVPVTGGNVSLHNETSGHPIWPTAVIGAVGRHSCPLEPVPDAPMAAGMDILWVGPEDLGLGGSIFESLYSSRLTPYPRANLTQLAEVLAWVTSLARTAPGIALRTIEEGGLFVAMSRAFIKAPEKLGITVKADDPVVEWLFSEAVGQFVIFSTPESTARLLEESPKSVTVRVIGQTTLDGALQFRAHKTLHYSREELERTFAQGYRG
ncbi:MAG: phosphoribosylformylglycinamidine synthase subunit PurL [Sulfobacillus thermosulfidooxidans]|nr:MAG: phosphoribosylformylglycinamidine synthase subunit PurL [Sulfobacillus thermosulfidooxidans]